MRDYGKFLADDQAFTTDAVSEHTMNLAAANKQLGHSGRQLYAHFLVKTAFATLTSGVQIFIVDSAASALSSDRVLAIFTSENCSDAGVIPVTDIDAAGNHLVCALPPGIKFKQYVGAHWLPASEAASAGACDIWISDKAEMA